MVSARSVSVVLRAEVGQFKADMAAAGKAASDAAQKTETGWKNSTSTLGKLAGTTKQYSSELSTVGTALTAMGGAVLGVGAMAAKTGASFQSLQQTSRAALTTTMGSAEAAAGQMKKLNEYGQKSWVMRDVLIRAQTQMTGFGIETKKVIPYLEGLAEAVAASGGSNQQFEELATTMSKIHSAQKITAQDFIEFGNRGIDAAALIGEAMGKTGAQIRQEVTAGTLGADEALDALAQGMSTKFEGATDNLRNTFRGAVDNLSAAWRDFSAELVSPFIKTEGGGIGVSAINGLADMLNAYKDLPGPVKAATTGLVGFGAAATTLVGTTMLLAPKIVETMEAIKALNSAGVISDSVMGTLSGSMGKLGRVAKVAGLAIGAIGVGLAAGRAAAKISGEFIDSTSRSVEEMTNKLSLLGDATRVDTKGGLLDPAIWEEANSFWTKGIGAKDIESWGDAFERTNDKATAWLDTVLGTRTDVTILGETIANTDAALSQLVSSGNFDQAAEGFQAIASQAPDMLPEEVLERFPEFRDQLTAMATDMGVTADDATLVKIAMGEMVPSAEGAAGAVSLMSPAAQEAQQTLADYADQLREGVSAFLNFEKSAKDTKLTLSQWIDDMERQLEAQRNWVDNMGDLAERGAPQEFLDFLVSLGQEGAFRVQQLADASDTELQRAVDAFNEGKTSADDLTKSILGIPDIDLKADASELRKQVDKAKEKLKELEDQPTSPVVDAQITLLKDKIKQGEKKLDELDGKKATAKVDADTKDATKGIDGVRREAEDLSNKPWIVRMIAKWTTPSGDKGKPPKERTTTRRSDIFHDGALALPMASGGLTSMSRIAQMVPPNTWRVVGDRMDVDEAFIPLDGSRRSWAIMMETLRRMPGTMPMARGGVASAQSRVYDAQNALTRARRQKSDAKTRSAKQTAERRIRAAQDELVLAKRSLAATKKRAQADERAAKQAAKQAAERRKAEQARRKAEQERKARVGELRSDLRTDVRRGSLRDQVTGSLSGAYSAVDRMAGLGGNKDLSKSSRNLAGRSARKFETSLKRLYGQAERLDDRLKAAQDKARELEGIHQSVTSGLMSGRKIDLGDYDAFERGQWTTHTGVAGANRRMSADVGQLRAFADRLDKLRKAGVPGAILQEIASAGPAEGVQLADAFLGASKSERQSYIGLWQDYEKQSNRIGQIVTEGFHKGGLNAAQGVVKGLESQKSQIEKQIERLAKSMESTFKQVLGIRSPSRVMAELGQYTAQGLAVGMESQLARIQTAAQLMADSATPKLDAIQVTMADMPEASTLMEDMSSQTLTAMAAMRDAVQQSMLTQQATTRTAQQGMTVDTQTAQTAMTATTRTGQAQSRQTTAAEQQTMLTTVRANQAGMLADTRLRQSEMLTSTRTNFGAMRQTGISEIQTLRSTNAATQSGMRADHSSHMASMRAVNREGFHNMRDTGVSAFRGLRDGMHGQMQAARPTLGSDLNRLIDVFSKFTTEVNKAFGDVGVKLKAPSRLAFAGGGVLPGYTPGRDVHHFRSRTGGDLYLSGGESIMRPEFTRMVGGERGIHELNQAARRGDMSTVHAMTHNHFANGGVIPAMRGVNAFADSGIWRPWWALVKKQFPQARLHSAYRPGSITATGNRSHHGAGRAIDITPSMSIFNWLRDNYGPQTRELIFSPAGGRQLHRGRPHMYTGVTRAMHFNHIHLAAMRPPAGAGTVPPGEWDMYGDGSFTPSYPFLEKAGVKPGADMKKAYREAAQKQLAKIRKNVSTAHLNPYMGQMARAIMDQAGEGLVKKAEDYGKANTFTMPTGSGVGRWRDTVIQALQRAGLPTSEDYVSAWLRQIKTESGGNPNILQQVRDVNSGGNEAMGLVQVIPGTFAAFRDKSLPNDRKHPLANLVAGMNWAKFKAKRQGRSMLSFIGHGHGYKDGTQEAANGWAWVGEHGPELVKFHGGEQVIPHDQITPEITSNLRMANTRSTAGTGGVDYDRLAQTLAAELAKQPQLVQHIDSTGLTEKRVADLANRQWRRAQNLNAVRSLT